MPKICGFLTKEARDAGVIESELRSMLRAMRHDSEQPETYLNFPGGRGGLATLRYPFEPTPNLTWHRDRTLCAGYAGHVVGILGNADGVWSDGPESTCDLLLRGWERWGEELFVRLNGVFSLAVFDCAAGSLTVAGDRYGLFPVYYHACSTGLWFASEVKALLTMLTDVEPDWQGWADFFYIGHMMGARTLVRGVNTLGSGEWVQFSGRGVRSKKYFDFTHVALMEPTEVSTEELASKFRKAVRRRARGGATHTVLLSGGFDSRLTLGALHREGLAPRVVTLEHADEHRGLDGALAVRIAERLGLECEMRPTRRGFYDSASWREIFSILDGMVPNRNLFISQVYAELDSSMGVVWDSLALDMTLGGYHGYDTDPESNLARFSSEREKLRPVLEALLAPEVFRALDEGFQDRLRAEYDAVPKSPNSFIFFLIQHRVRRRAAVNPYQLYASRVKPTSPTVDAEFLDYVLAIPNELKVHHRLYLETLRRHFPELLKIPACSAGEVFLGSKDPLLILRHYDWKFGAKNWLSRHPRSKEAVLAVRRQIKRQPVRERLDARTKGCSALWLRRDLPTLTTPAREMASRALNYLDLWGELVAQERSATSTAKARVQ